MARGEELKDEQWGSLNHICLNFQVEKKDGAYRGEKIAK
jgi:hypothetical protein